MLQEDESTRGTLVEDMGGVGGIRLDTYIHDTKLSTQN